MTPKPRSSQPRRGWAVLTATFEVLGLVRVRPEAQRRWYELRSEPLAEVDAWPEPYRQMWAGRLDRPGPASRLVGARGRRARARWPLPRGLAEHGRRRERLRDGGQGLRDRSPDEYRSRTLAGWHTHLDYLPAMLDGRDTDQVNLPGWDENHAAYEARDG